MTDFYSRNDVNYNGDVYSIPFPYIKEEEIQVFLDDTLFEDWFFLNDSQIKLRNIPQEVTSNTIVTVRRNTDIDKKVVTYTNNTLLNKENLNLSQDQLLYAVQEIYDNNVQFQSDIREEVDEKVERVSDAVEKLEFLEDSVEIANEAALEATEQAQIATEKAEVTLNTYNEAMAEIDTLRQNSIEDIDQLVADHTNDLNSLDATIKKDAEDIINRLGISMFDTILKDYRLTYKESKGLALQGTYVYKEAIAGSRYGYPDFYNKCLEEYRDKYTINKKIYLKSNISLVGSVVDTKGVLSGFSKSNYATLPSYFAPGANPWEFVTKITTGDLSTNSVVIGCANAYKSGVFLWVSTDGLLSINASSNGTSFNILSNVKGSTKLSANTDYWFKVEFTGSEYNVYYSTSGVIWDLEITAESSTAIYQGSYYWVLGGGVISSTTWFSNTASLDLNESYINITNEDGFSERWWSGVDNISIRRHLNGHIYYNATPDISEKDKIDEYFGIHGTAWFYGVDTKNERIFLPRNNYFEQATADSTWVGHSVEAGLPNITGWTNGEETDAGGAFYHEKALTGGCNNGSNKYEKINFDASLSNPIYGNSDTVQPNAVKKLLYICVGNTETVSSITDVVDVTTAENDTTPLFTGMYFDFTPNNVSWLKAGVQANSAGIYTTCYNELVNVLNGEIKYGDLKVVDTADMIAGVDYSEYWKVNQDDMTFTTPTAISNKAYSDIAPVVGNGMTLGLTDGTINFGLTKTNSNGLGAYTGNYGLIAGSQNTGSGVLGQNSVGITTDLTKSGIEAHLQENETAQLYFKVANAVQNLELLNVGEVMEAVTDKISRHDCPAYIVESYSNGASGYVIYSNNLCEQWGISTATGTNLSVSLLKAYKDTNYYLAPPSIYASASTSTCAVYWKTKNVDSFVYTNAGNANGVHWRTLGYIA